MKAIKLGDLYRRAELSNRHLQQSLCACTDPMAIAHIKSAMSGLAGVMASLNAERTKAVEEEMGGRTVRHMPFLTKTAMLESRA